MDLKATVISGEASESDDEAGGCVSATLTDLVPPSIRLPNTHGTIVSGEAPESDDDGTSHSSISGGAVDACAPYASMKPIKPHKSSVKYNSLLHKKLRDCNKTLDSNLLQLTEGTVNTATQDLSVINRQLLKSELTLQEIVCQLRSATARTKETCDVLQQLSDASFLHSVKI